MPLLPSFPFAYLWTPFISVGQFNSLTKAACLVLRWWCAEQPLLLCRISFSLSLCLHFFRSLVIRIGYSALHLARLISPHGPPEKEHMQILRVCLSCTHTYMSNKAIATTQCAGIWDIEWDHSAIICHESNSADRAVIYVSTVYLWML